MSLKRSSGSRSSLGLSGLTGQVYRKAQKRGFDFTIMVCGEANLGKTTMINTLFSQKQELRDAPPAVERMKATVEIESRREVLSENNVSLKLTVIDTPGFGESLNNDKCWDAIVQHLDDGFDAYLHDESQLDRTKIKDNRVHCCLYFISPFGRGLKPLDIQALQALHHKVNIIPVIGKADALTKQELQSLKEQVRNQLQEHEINVFIPAIDDEDPESVEEAELYMQTVPFAVIGSTTGQSRSTRGRQYPWGIAEVENEDHNDFKTLRNIIVRGHMQDLKDVTSDILYENYRKEMLASRPHGQSFSRESFSGSRQISDVPAPITDDSDLARRQEEMRRQLEEQERLLEEQRRKFEEERRRFEEEQKKLMAAKAGLGETV